MTTEQTRPISDDEAQVRARVAFIAQDIVAMVAALECDNSRLQDLRDERDACTIHDADAEELAELEAAAGDCADEDEARERIMEDPLSVEVRSDWQCMGETLTPAEFCILLCTGGPAVRIVGDLSDGEPSRPRVEYQGWGTPWTEYSPTPEQRDALQTYVECFYFGE
jgi:hypothetical protein